MHETTIPLNAVLFWEDGCWMAHAPEYDLLGDGSTRNEAMASLVEAILAQLEEAVVQDDMRILHHAAPAEDFSDRPSVEHFTGSLRVRVPEEWIARGEAIEQAWREALARPHPPGLAALRDAAIEEHRNGQTEPHD